MKYLLDTHSVLWSLGDKENLSETAVRVILDPSNDVYVSIASAWELVIKISLGKLVFEGGIERFFRVIDENGFELLPVKEKHVKGLENLPYFHRDPFDRILITSAITEDMCLITADANIHRYNVVHIW
jgi:PIN domain nuclease of toxin-antitoxin system